MLKLDRSKVPIEIQFSNISFISSTFFVSNFFKFKLIKDVIFLNIPFIVLELLVSNPDKSKEVSSEQPKNISLISSELFVDNLEIKFVLLRLEHPSNI